MPPRPDAAGLSVITLSVGSMSVVVDPSDGGRAVSWTVAGRELLMHHGDDPIEHGMYPMAPWAGRIRGNTVPTGSGTHPLPETYGPWALHGTVVTKPMQVVSLTITDDRADLELVSDSHPEWPWPMVVRTRWTLHGQALTTQIEVEASGEPFPAVVGWHPWFAKMLDGVAAQWQAEIDGMLVRDGSALPAAYAADVTPGPHDDAFSVPSGECRVTWPGVLTLQIVADSGWYVVFDELPDALCVEPQTGPPDGLVDHEWSPVQVASPGRPVRQTVSWQVRDLQAG